MGTQHRCYRAPNFNLFRKQVGALTLLATLGGCAASAPQSAMIRDPLFTGCPNGSLRTCEVIGGNKFQKRYGRCICAHR